MFFRTFLMMTGVFFLLSPLADAQTDTIARQLDEAEAMYLDAMQKYHNDLLAWFSDEEAKARAAGRIKDVDVLAEALDEYRDSGRVPLIAPVKLNQRAWTAQQKFESALIKIAGEYTKKKNDAQSKNVREKLEAFRRKTDRLPARSRWAGQVVTQSQSKKQAPTQGLAKATVVERGLESVLIRAELSDQRQWHYDFASTPKGYLLRSAKLIKVQNSFGDQIGEYPAEGTLEFSGPSLVISIRRRIKDDLRVLKFVLEPEE